MSFFSPSEDGRAQACASADQIKKYKNEIEMLHGKISQLTSALVCKNHSIAHRLKRFISKNAERAALPEASRGTKRTRTLAPYHQKLANSQPTTTNILRTEKLLQFIEGELLVNNKMPVGQQQTLHDALRTICQLDSAKGPSQAAKSLQRPARSDPYNSTDFYTQNTAYPPAESDTSEEEPMALTPQTSEEIQLAKLRLSPGCRQFAMPLKRPREFPLEAE